MSENETQPAAEEKVEETAAAETTEKVEAKTEEATDSTEVKAEAAQEPEAKAEPETPEEPEEISYHAVEKEGEISAIWEMQGKKHIRTISSRSAEGQKILSLFTSEIHETDSPAMSDSAATEEASA